MVSPSVLPNFKIPSLSYAERAKKAQNITSSIAVRHPHSSVALATIPPAASDSTASTVSSSKESDSSAISSSLSSTTLSTQPSSPAVSILAHASDNAATETKLPNASSETMTPTITTTQQSAAERAVKVLSIVEAHQKSYPPSVNIWTKRLEQAAAARPAAPAASESRSDSSSKPAVPPSHPSADNLPNLPRGPGSAKQKDEVTPNAPSFDSNEDPFTVRLPPKQTRAPSSTDPELWPEVGKVLPSQPPTSTKGVHPAEQERTAENTSSSTTNTNKKGEKKKWIPANDLLPVQESYSRTQSRSHSRKGSQQSNRNPHTANHSGNSNHDTHNGTLDGPHTGPRQQQRRYRDRSGHNSNSHSAVQSASHSRVASRTASATSSPRFPRGLPLHDDPPTVGTNGSAPSPHSVAPDLIPPHTSNTNSPRQIRVVLPPTSTDFPAHPSSIYDPPPNMSTYYPPPLHPYPQHYGHGAHSPGHAASGSSSMSAYPSYPINPYVDYGASSSTTPPYPYWSNSHPGSGYHTPTYIPHGLTHYPAAPGIPIALSNDSSPSHVSSPPHASSPPSGMPIASRPPVPSEQSVAVAGYRAVLDGDKNQQQVLFGSIDVPGASQCPSPAPPRPEGLDLEKSFSAFSIGVGPGESGSSKLATDKSTETTNDKTEGTKWEFGTAGSVDDTGNTSSIQNGIPNESSNMNGESRNGDDDFAVKDFGFGFGSREVAQERESKEPGDQAGRERGPSMSPNSNRSRRGYGFDRGGFNGRRGRGSNGHWGGNPRHQRGGYRQQHTPYNATHPPQLPPPVMPMPDPMTNYLPPPRFVSFEPYQPPMPPPPQVPPFSPSQSNGAPFPSPVTNILFPLDTTRWYLLGQLEYYLSPQNMAQDFFLRQQMNSRGWIPIPLIASFNRIKRLTPDVQLVREVLTLSSIVQVKEDYVRMKEWERYTLPGAPPCAFEEDAESDDEIEIVMGNEEPIGWSPAEQSR